MLIRIHSGATYPAKNNKDTKKLDMESHAVLIVGYDDQRKEFDIIDPWDKSWGGSKGGIGTISYEIMPIVCVNATAEKSTRITCVQKNIETYKDNHGNTGIKLKFGFYVPRGYIIDQKQSKFTKFVVNISYNIDGNNLEYHDVIEGSWSVGEIAETSIPLGKDFKENVKLSFSVDAFIEGERPYKYRDKISFKFDHLINVENNSLSENNDAEIIKIGC